MPEARKQYPLRISKDIWQALEAWAQDEMRSTNGQIEWILRDALRRTGRLTCASKQRTNTRARAPEVSTDDTTDVSSASTMSDSSSDALSDMNSSPEKQI